MTWLNTLKKKLFFRKQREFRRKPQKSKKTITKIEEILPTPKETENVTTSRVMGETTEKVSFGERICQFFKEWEKLTSDQIILSYIKGVTFDFHEIPRQEEVHREYKFHEVIKNKIDEEINNFLSRGIIEHSKIENNQVISNIFCRNKPSGEIRIIGNFHDLNAQIIYKKFKQTTVSAVLDMVTPGCFMTSIDLKDAYYCLAIYHGFRKFVKFKWQNQLFQFTCMGNGIGSAPRIFTKVMKIPISYLREEGINVAAYIDDLILFHDNAEQLIQDTETTLKLLQQLGYVINWDKSSLKPSQCIEHLGLKLNSISMTAKLTEKKCDNIIHICSSLKKNCTNSIRQVSKAIGTMVSYLPGVENGIMHYRELEKCKNAALKTHKGNFEANMALNEKALKNLTWWETEIYHQEHKLIRPKPSAILFTDSSKLMWGCVMGTEKTGGNWSEEEKLDHINVLEMKAILFGLKSLCSNLDGQHIRIRTDSLTSVYYINKKGGSKSDKCNSVALDIWEWCLKKSIFISAIHISGIENDVADYESRNQDNSSEWSLKNDIFDAITYWSQVKPTIDLFASRINCKVKRFIAWQADPEAIGVDALMHYYDDEIFYAFPPFGLIQKFLNKVEVDNLEGILIIPCWSTQHFFESMLKLLIELPIFIRWRKGLLQHPQIQHHPIGKRLHLLACNISGPTTKRRALLSKLQQ